MRKHNKTDSSWHWFDYDAITFKTTYVKFGDDNRIHFLETIPDWLATRILEENKEKAKQFTENGGWAGAKYGAIVANVPDIIDQEFKRKAGFDPTKGGWYDRDKYNSFLDSSDYAHLRTGGGKIGKRKAPGLGIQSRLKKLVVPVTA